MKRELVDLQIECQENEKLNKTQTRLRAEIQKLKKSAIDWQMKRKI